MTPQQRHIKAHEILATIVPFSEWCPRWQEAVNELALALAEAENRAAWDGWDSRIRWSNESFQERWHKIEDDFAAKYGPRPSQELEHE